MLNRLSIFDKVSCHILFRIEFSAMHCVFLSCDVIYERPLSCSVSKRNQFVAGRVLYRVYQVFGLNLIKRSDIIIFGSFLNTFEVSSSFLRSWCNSINWYEPKTKSQSYKRNKIGYLSKKSS